MPGMIPDVAGMCPGDGSATDARRLTQRAGAGRCTATVGMRGYPACGGSRANNKIPWHAGPARMEGRSAEVKARQGGMSAGGG